MGGGVQGSAVARIEPVRSTAFLIATKHDLFLFVAVDTDTFVALEVGVAVRLVTQWSAALALQ